MKKVLEDSIKSIQKAAKDYEAQVNKGKSEVTDEIMAFLDALKGLSYKGLVSVQINAGELRWGVGTDLQLNRETVIGMPIRVQKMVLDALPELGEAIENAMKKEME